MTEAKELGAPYELLCGSPRTASCPSSNFAAGGVATPADAALMMALGADGVFVGSGIFKSGDPERRARAIVQAVTHYNDPADPGRSKPRPGRSRWSASTFRPCRRKS